eukprot:COSAG02_NODE_984_length_15467_cov_20.165799_4_plen_96_part_00
MLAPLGLAGCSAVLACSDAVTSACAQTELDLKKGMDRAEAKNRRSEIAALRVMLCANTYVSSQLTFFSLRRTGLGRLGSRQTSVDSDVDLVEQET